MPDLTHEEQVAYWRDTVRGDLVAEIEQRDAEIVRLRQEYGVLRRPERAWQGKCGHIWQHDGGEDPTCPYCAEIGRLRAALHKLDRHFEDSGYNDGRIDFVGTFHDAKRTIRAALDGVDERSTPERPAEEGQPRHNPDAVYIDGR